MPDKSYSSKTSLIAHQLTYQLPNGLSLLTELNFSLPVGITGLVGRNGCGKSILARLLAGEIKPGSGHVDYGG
ncbi:MAG: ATP-binding cassette domain-containing protein, partial [Oceanospirillum sp.]|nr:ATP-binding cassette domain-containing protein [Oceanospirillum sp.]